MADEIAWEDASGGLRITLRGAGDSILRVIKECDVEISLKNRLILAFYSGVISTIRSSSYGYGTNQQKQLMTLVIHQLYCMTNGYAGVSVKDLQISVTRMMETA